MKVRMIEIRVSPKAYLAMLERSLKALRDFRKAAVRRSFGGFRNRGTRAARANRGIRERSAGSRPNGRRVEDEPPEENPPPPDPAWEIGEVTA